LPEATYLSKGTQEAFPVGFLSHGSLSSWTNYTVLFRKIFGPKRDEVAGGWRKLHKKELYSLYCSPSITRMIKSRRMRWEGHVARMGEKRIAYRLLVGKPEGKRPPERPKHTWMDNIRIDLREIGWGGAHWIGLAQDKDN
jgi:hypothetical protein